MRLQRHSWGEKTVISAHKSERQCQKCGLVKASRYEHNSHWVEYWRGLDRVDVIRTPACETVSN